MPSPPKHPGLIGSSPEMDTVRRFVERAAYVDALVLLLGETGTGKSLIARIIHDRGARASGPFVALNCAAVPKALFESELFGHRRGTFTGAHEDRVGLIESAHRGTVLLDEVGDLPPAQQAKLLTVLEEGEVRPVGARRPSKVDVRVVSATSRELEGLMGVGAFRRDLFHRLALLRVRLPPLRERPGDVEALAEHFLRASASRHRIPRPRLDPPTLRLLAAHPWPGNVRELGHAVEAAHIVDAETGFGAALASMLAGHALPPSESAPTAAAPAPADRYSCYGTVEEERDRIRAVLARCRGNRTHAARELGMSRNTLRDRMHRYGL